MNVDIELKKELINIIKNKDITNISKVMLTELTRNNRVANEKYVIGEELKGCIAGSFVLACIHLFIAIDCDSSECERYITEAVERFKEQVDEMEEE